MDLFKLDISEIAGLVGDVAITGAVKVMTGYADETFDFIVAIAQIIDGGGR